MRIGDGAQSARWRPSVAPGRAQASLAMLLVCGCGSSGSGLLDAPDAGGSDASVSAGGSAGVSSGGSSDGGKPTTGGRGPGGDGGGPSGGTSGGGTAGTAAGGDGGATLSTDAGLDGSGDAAVPSGTFDPCCGTAGSCVVPSSLTETDQTLFGAGSCSSGEVCAPTDLVKPGFVPAPCRSSASTEGRCLSTCIPDVATQASFLPQDTCAANERCVPCFDPAGGATTGVCERAGDAPTESGQPFDACCGDAGSCVPATLLGATQSLLEQSTCSTGRLCTPNDFVGFGVRPQPCESVSGGEGRCVPDCVPAIADRPDILGGTLLRSSCESAEVCAPCYDAITGADTTFCRQNGDAPTEAPYTYPGCCGGAGLCFPEYLVPLDLASTLDVDACPSAMLCVPDTLRGPTTPTVCHTFGVQSREGRCMPTCLPRVGALASLLQQENCDPGELCVPCFDPVEGSYTGACSFGTDAPTEPAADPYAVCAHVPSGCGACATCDARCVPDYLVPTNLAAVLPSGAGLPAPCVAGELCAPCTNPLDGTSTGYCTGGGACPP